MAKKKPRGERLSRAGGDVVPLHHRVYVVLREKLGDGSFPPDRAMPTELQLQDVFGVSRVTVRTALDRLAREGRIARARGRGTFPVARRARPTAGDSAILRNQISLAFKTRVRVLRHGIEPATASVANALDLAPGAPVLRIVRVRRDDASPISWSICRVPADLAPLLPRERIGSLPISVILASGGIALAAFRERITATAADSEIAPALDVEIGAPLIAMTRVVRDSAGRAVEWLRALYRPDRYEYAVAYTADERGRPESPWYARITDSSR
jgi:GntR family transcriptional regulator